MKTCICNAGIILPDAVVRGSVLIEEGKISNVSEDAFPGSAFHPDVLRIDAEGAYVMPGMIDIHSDAIEKEIQPRPSAMFPVEMAFHELDRKLAGCGITTMYHSLTLSDEWGIRDSATVVGIIQEVNRLNKERAMIDHRIHLRYEVTYLDGLEILTELINSASIHFMSYMDHAPGQGQFRDPEALKKFSMRSYGKNEQDVEKFINRILECREKIDRPGLVSIAKAARNRGIRLASHDDDTSLKIDTLLECRGVVSEFPINLETAIFASRKGLHVCVGAPNIVRGKSHGNNMRAMDAIRHHAADILCSDYLPSAMLPAVFKIAAEGLDLPGAVRMATLNPATALGLQEVTGSIEEGRNADLILVEISGGYPVVRKTVSGGRLVYQADYIKSRMEELEYVC